MSYSDINRFMELQNALSLMESKNNVNDSLRGPASIAALKAKESFKRHAPEGKDEPDYVIEQHGQKISVSHGRPSVRLFGVTLAEAWNIPKITDGDNAVEFSITSSAPHMRWIMDGTRGHSIPKRTPGPMSFWSFAEGRPFVSYWYKSFIIDHPGMERSNFVEESLSSGLEDDIGDQLSNALRLTARPLNKYFSK